MEQQETKTSYLETVVNVMNKFYSSHWSLIFYMTITTLFGLMQILLFYFGILQINGHSFGETNAEKVFWITTSISLFSCYVGFISGILSVRGSLYFLPFATVQILCSMVVAVEAKNYFLALSMLSSLVIFYIRFFIWKGGYVEKWNLKKKQWLPYAFLAMLVLLGIGFAIVSVYGNEMYEGKPEWTWYFDVSACMVVIIAAVAFTLKSRWSYILFTISKIFSVAIYAQQGNIVPIVQLLLFTIMDLTGFLSWSSKAWKERMIVKE